jgi:hypothetical protein
MASKQLSKEIGQALQPLVNIILEWGGDIIKFAGECEKKKFPLENLQCKC